MTCFPELRKFQKLSRVERKRPPCVGFTRYLTAKVSEDLGKQIKGTVPRFLCTYPKPNSSHIPKT